MSDDERVTLSAQQLEDINNKLERVRSDTHNINRILTLTNKDKIIGEIRKAVGRSEVRAAILTLTKEWVSAGELARQLGISPENLGMYMKPLLNRGYITVMKRGKQRFYERSELVELVEFESIEEFEKLLKSWKESREMGVESTPAEEQVQTVALDSKLNEP
jgi:DNA-binding transcriptional ArsR family regulator